MSGEAAGRGGRTLFIPREGGCKVRGPCGVRRSPSTLLTDSWRFPGCCLPQMVRGLVLVFFFPLFCLLHFRGKRKETFLGFKINKASQQTRRGESKGSNSRAFEPKNYTKVEKLRRLPPVSKASQTIRRSALPKSISRSPGKKYQYLQNLSICVNVCEHVELTKGAE